MPLVLRKLTRQKWYKKPNDQWLNEDELQADALVDLRTSSNKLSVWRIEYDLSNLKRIIAALATTKKDTIDPFDYILIDLTLLESSGFKFDHTSHGDTPDIPANEKWHSDMIELTTNKLFQLVTIIQGKKQDITREEAKTVKNHVKDSIKNNFISTSHLSPKLLGELK